MRLSAGRPSSRRKWLGAWAVAAIAVAGMGVPGPSDGAAAARTGPGHDDRSGDATALANYDARILSGDRRAQADARQVRSNGKAVTRLSRSLGPEAVVDIDPLTGTPDQVSSRSLLTGPSDRSAASVALDYVRAHLAAFGVARDDLATLVKVREYTDIHGITHVFWAQEVAGDRVFGNGLRAHVDRTGRLISVQGAPVAGLGALPVGPLRPGSAALPPSARRWRTRASPSRTCAPARRPTGCGSSRPAGSVRRG